MLENSSVELKTLVLLEFTKRLIISKNPMEFLVKQELSKTKRDEFIDKVKEKTRSFQLSSENFGQEKIGIQTQRKISMQRPIQTAPILKIPETRLPPQFAYLRPYATNEIDLDLGGLNPFLADSAVNVIESNGPGKAVIVKGGMGTKPTNVILSEQEINQIIQIFSKKSKIPAGEGAVKIALGRYILSAIISEEAGSRFIIQKLPPISNPMMPRK
mgnify:CR=1 FL=1